jgi:hypothetical protein
MAILDRLYRSELRSRSDLDWLDGWVPPEWIYAEPDEEAGGALVSRRSGWLNQHGP